MAPPWFQFRVRQAPFLYSSNWRFCSVFLCCKVYACSLFTLSGICRQQSVELSHFKVSSAFSFSVGVIIFHSKPWQSRGSWCVVLTRGRRIWSVLFSSVVRLTFKRWQQVWTLSWRLCHRKVPVGSESWPVLVALQSLALFATSTGSFLDYGRISCPIQGT